MDTHEALTYPRLNLKDNTLDENLPPARLFGHAFDVNEPEVDLGSLNLLPLELLYSVMASLDLCSISTLRMVNRQSLMTVDTFPPFKCIIKHAHPALHGALMIHSAKWITCEKLFKIICTSEYLPYTFTGRKSRAFSRILDILPHMRSISGIYSPNEKQESRQLCLWDRESVQQCGDLEVMKRVGRVASKAFDGKSGNKLRFMAIVEAPVLDHQTGKTESGVYCSGCRDSTGQRSQHFRRRYSSKTFALHIKECGSITGGKHQNQ
ncbi:hypothetical protein D6D08_09996 [Aureobasidium pullulans]|nr:hypothetical protein D6D08_09996 [Aureobasidium pullulans]